MREGPNTRIGIRLLLAMLALVVAVAVGIMAIVLAVYTVVSWKLAYWTLGVVGVLVAAVFVYTVYCLIVFAHRRNYQFGLRTLLIATAILALFLGLVVKPVFDLWQRHHAFRSVIDAGGQFYHLQKDYQEGKKLTPSWTESRLGYDPTAEKAIIIVSTDSALTSIAQQTELFSEVQYLEIGENVTDAGFARAEQIGKLSGLSIVFLSDTPVTDAGFESISKWSQVEVLCINGCSKLSDDGLTHLHNMKQLKKLMLVAEGGGTLNITDAGMVHLEQVPRLESVWVLGFGIGDFGLDHLTKLKHLKEVCLSRTAVTKAGVERLRKALPNCKVTWHGVAVVPSGTLPKKTTNKTAK